VTIALPVVAFGLLTVVFPGTGLVAVFAAVYGAANGMMTVVRAVLPMEIFGRGDYGAIQGMIAAPATFSKAVGPFLFGLIWAWSGSYDAVILVALIIALVALTAFATAVYTASTDAH
jgi:hypothetical protein